MSTENPGQNPGTGGNEHPVFSAPWSNQEGVYKVGEGEAAKPWWGGIQEEPIVAFAEAKQYKNPDEAMRALWNANKLLNDKADAVLVPKEGASEQEWNDFYKKLGRPDSVDKYDLKAKEGTTVDEKLLSFGKSLFFEMGLSPAQAQKAFEKWNAFASEHSASIDKGFADQNEEAVNKLVARYESEGKLKEMQAAGQSAVKALGLSTELINTLEAHIGAAPVIELLAAIGSKTSEGRFKAGGSEGGGNPSDPSNMTKEQAKAEINKLRGNKEFMDAYELANHPGHAEALSRMQKLYART